MKHRIELTLCATVILFLFTRLAPGQRPLAVGYRAVVDIETIRREHRRYRAMVEDLKKDRQAVVARDTKLQSEIDALVAKRDNLAPLSDEAQRLSIEIFTREGHAQFLREHSTEELKRQQEKMDFNLSKEIEVEIERFAVLNGIDVVLNTATPKVNEGLTLDEAKALFEADVVFHAKLDITQLILKRLN